MFLLYSGVLRCDFLEKLDSSSFFLSLNKLNRKKNDIYIYARK